MSYKYHQNNTLAEILIVIGLIGTILGLAFSLFNIGQKYTVKINGEVVHENVRVYQDFHNNTLTVHDKDGKICKYNGNWELLQE